MSTGPAFLPVPAGYDPFNALRDYEGKGWYWRLWSDFDGRTGIPVVVCCIRFLVPDGRPVVREQSGVTAAEAVWRCLTYPKVWAEGCGAYCWPANATGGTHDGPDGP